MAVSKNGVAEWRSYWLLPFAAALGYATSVLHIYSIGPFIEPLQQEFGWSRAQISSGITIASFVSAIALFSLGSTHTAEESTASAVRSDAFSGQGASEQV